MDDLARDREDRQMYLQLKQSAEDAARAYGRKIAQIESRWPGEFRTEEGRRGRVAKRADACYNDAVRR